MAKVLRITRHVLEDSAQAEALQAAVTKLTGEEGPHEVLHHMEQVQSAKEALELARKCGAVVVEAVLPLPMVAEVVNPKVNTEGVAIIQARMERELGPDGNAKTFNFRGYKRVVKVEVITEEL